MGKVDVSDWRQLIFIVPVTDDELASAKEKALEEFDTVREDYKALDFVKSLEAADRERSKFVHSLETDEGYTLEQGDDTDKLFGKFYWWSYGYGFQNTRVYSVDESLLNSKKRVTYIENASKYGHNNIPYKEIDRLDVLSWHGSKLESARTFKDFLRAYRKEVRKLFKSSKRKFSGLTRHSFVISDENLAKIKRFFDEHPDGMVAFDF